MATTLQEYLLMRSRVRETKALIAELCRHFYHLGWLSGTGGSITIKVHHHSIPKSGQLIVVSPSGMQKERMTEEDMYVLSPDGSVLSEPLAKPWPHKPPSCSDCSPLFLKAYEMRNAGAIIHSHGIESCIVTMIHPLSKEFRITHMEMIKGIEGHGYHDTLVIPIIENAAHEGELTESFAQALEAYPKTTAVLVRNHGVFVWGESWISTKTQAECYHYLFDAAIKLHQLGLDWSTPSHSPIHSHRNASISLMALNNCVIVPARKCIVLRSGVTISKFQPPKVRTNWTYVCDDLPRALEKWHSIGIKVYIYSSTFSRMEQRICFGNTNYGDLRKYLCGFFDDNLGDTEETESYFEIKEYLGVDNASEILFITGLYKEATAAKEAGLEVIISQREEGHLPENHGFRTIISFSEI